jgi:curved DNA-binding protein CbpA
VDDHYATLRVRPSASRAEIERAYRRLARRYHPDLLTGAGQEARRRAEATLKRVNAAYTVIGDPQRRLAYDRQRAERRARAMAQRPRPAAPAAARDRPPVVQTTEHWVGDGPFKIEWTAPPVTPKPRPRTDLASPRRLLWGAALIVLFAILLAFAWRPAGEQVVAPATQVLPAPTVPAPTPSPDR